MKLEEINKFEKVRLPHWGEGEYVYFDNFLMDENKRAIRLYKDLICRDDFEYVEEKPKAGDFIVIGKGVLLVTDEENHPLIYLEDGLLVERDLDSAREFKKGNYKKISREEALERLRK